MGTSQEIHGSWLRWCIDP